MRSIKLMGLIAIVLILLAGPASWFATAWIDSALTSHAGLFVTAWVFSSLGIIGGVSIIGSVESSKSFGTDQLMSELFGTLLAVLTVMAVVLLILGGLVYGLGADMAGASADMHIYLTFVVASLAGCIMGFLVEFAVFADESWLGRTSIPSRRSLRRVS